MTAGLEEGWGLPRKTTPVDDSRELTPAPPEHSVTRPWVLRGSFRSAATFRATAYQEFRGDPGFFLEMDPDALEFGVTIPVEIYLRRQKRSFQVHGRVLWRRAKPMTTPDGVLPAGIAIAFVESMDDDLDALFAVLEV